MSIEKSIIPSVCSDGLGVSKFSCREIELEGQPLRRLSQQQSALNFRLRTSDTSYASDWHVAGDPTLLIILKGAVEIELRNGQTKVFRAGDMFVAEDFLKSTQEFTDTHGHRAKVVGSESLSALHLKLEKRA
jgi:uncharacterized cupin superfamily protein